MCIRDRAHSEIKKQRIEADMRTQISHIEAMERRDAEFVIEKAKEKELVASEMQARMQLEREFAEEKQKNLRLEFEAKTRRLERDLRDKRLPPIKESESVETTRAVQDRNLETYVSRFTRPVQSRGTSDEPASCVQGMHRVCLLYTSPSPRDRQKSRMPSSA